MGTRRKRVKVVKDIPSLKSKLTVYQAEFITLFRESVVTQALLTLASGGTIFYLHIVGRVVPDQLENMFWSLAGIWIGGKLTLRPSK